MAEWIQKQIAKREAETVNGQSYGDMILDMCRMGRAGKWGKAMKKRDQIVEVMRTRDEFHAKFTEEGIECILTRMILP